MTGTRTAIDNRLQAHLPNLVCADLLLQFLLFDQTYLLYPQAVLLLLVMQNLGDFLERKTQGLGVLDQQQTT